MKAALVITIGAFVALGSAPVARADDAAVEALMKKSNCFKCHAIDKKKDGPSFRETAAKYKGKADAMDKLAKQLTTGPKVKMLDDKKEEEHKIVDTKDDKQVRNLVAWILKSGAK